MIKIFFSIKLVAKISKPIIKVQLWEHGRTVPKSYCIWATNKQFNEGKKSKERKCYFL